MVRLQAEVEAVIFGSHDAWSLEWQRGFAREGKRCRVQLEIQGDDNTGYNLIQRPDGFFTADTWHPTLDEAKRAATELFAVVSGVWR